MEYGRVLSTHCTVILPQKERGADGSRKRLHVE